MKTSELYPGVTWMLPLTLSWLGGSMPSAGLLIALQIVLSIVLSSPLLVVSHILACSRRVLIEVEDGEFCWGLCPDAKGMRVNFHVG